MLITEITELIILITLSSVEVWNVIRTQENAFLLYIWQHKLTENQNFKLSCFAVLNHTLLICLNSISIIHPCTRDFGNMLLSLILLQVLTFQLLFYFYQLKVICRLFNLNIETSKWLSRYDINWKLYKFLIFDKTFEGFFYNKHLSPLLCKRK